MPGQDRQLRSRARSKVGITISVLLAAVAFGLASARINHGLTESSLPTGPGLTLDESFNIGQGIYLFESLLDHGPLLFAPSTAKDVFGENGYLPDHPPLARVVLGAAHQCTAWMIGGTENAVFNVPAARLGSCAAFALTVLLLSEFTRRRYGIATAIAATVCFVLMPRVTGHARIAALETVTTLAWFAAVVSLLTWWTNDRAPTTRQCLISGVLWGVLMLTKVQGILLPPVVAVWAIWHFRLNAARPLAVWGIAGAVVFFVGWPWLWLDPVAHTAQYLGKAADRPVQLYVWYFGQRFIDKAVPWHFPFVMTVATVPLFITIGTVCRIIQRHFNRVEWLLLLSIVVPLCVFAVPGTPVYDATRLYLVIMPAIAILGGRGFVGLLSPDSVSAASDGTATCRLSHGAVAGRYSVAVVIVALATMVVPRVLHPLALCDYSLTIGGPQAAAAMGMEASYWADGLTKDFWNQIPENSVIYVAPVSHQFQLADLQQLVPIVQRRRLRLLPFEYDPQDQRGLMLMIHRLADLRPALRRMPDGATLIAETRYKGVILAQLFDTTSATWQDLPDWPNRSTKR